MSNIYSLEDYADEPFLAVDQIGEYLKSGALCLFLGAGVSAGFGLPIWKTLIARVLKRDEDPEFVSSLNNKSAHDLCRLLDDVDDGSLQYFELVHDALYRGVATELPEQLRRSPLLLAIAAMMTGAHRGRIDSVITYNYDDLLEQYVKMLGLAVCVRVLPDELSTRADVELNYVHGRLAQSWNPEKPKPEVFVFSDKSYIARRATNDEGWPAWIEYKLYSKLGLFLGLSGDDNVILETLTRVKGCVARTDDYLGFWVLTPDAFERNQRRIRDVGICPLPIEKDFIPSLIFDICQYAAR